MNSITLYTEEIDDLNEAALELFSQAEGFVFQKNSIGILYTLKFLNQDTKMH